jgi:hypothetical protein
MTFLRKMALKISDTVVRYASPGSREWAEGLARETDFIESDWSALAWALGSTRVLLHYREAPLGSLADLPAAAQKSADLRRRGSVAWIMFFSHALIYGDRFSHASNWSERAGCSLVVFGALSLGMITLLQWRNRQRVPPDDDIAALIQFYWSNLESMRDLYRSPRAWIVGVASVSYSAGLMLGERGGILAHPGWDAAIGLSWVGLALLVLHGRRTNVRRLERLEALLAERF